MLAINLGRQACTHQEESQQDRRKFNLGQPPTQVPYPSHHSENPREPGGVPFPVAAVLKSHNINVFSQTSEGWEFKVRTTGSFRAVFS